MEVFTGEIRKGKYFAGVSSNGIVVMFNFNSKDRAEIFADQLEKMDISMGFVEDYKKGE